MLFLPLKWATITKTPSESGKQKESKSQIQVYNFSVKRKKKPAKYKYFSLDHTFVHKHWDCTRCIKGNKLARRGVHGQVEEEGRLCQGKPRSERSVEWLQYVWARGTKKSQGTRNLRNENTANTQAVCFCAIEYRVIRVSEVYPLITIAFSPVVPRDLPDLSTWSSPRQSSGANLWS